jgi:hypothetical protein
MTTDTEALVRRAYYLAEGRSPGAAPGQRAQGRRRDRGIDPGHFPRAVRDARGRDPADRGQARHPDRRLLVGARWQDPGVQLPYRFEHHVRADGHTAGLHLRSRGVRGRIDSPESQGRSHDHHRATRCPGRLLPGRGSTCLTWSTSGPSVAHLRENIAGAALTLPADAVAELDAI